MKVDLSEQGAGWSANDQTDMTIEIEPHTPGAIEFSAAQIFGDPLAGCPAKAERDHVEDFALEVFVAHQDLVTGVRAKQTLDRLCRQLKPAQCLHLHLWRFELLEDSILWREAVRNASRADIVFFSLHGDRPLPSGLCHWFKHWLLMRDERPCALVVSLDESERDSESGRNALEYVRRVAATSGIELFPYFDTTPADSGFISNAKSRWNDYPAPLAASMSGLPPVGRAVSTSNELPHRRESCMAEEDPVPLAAAGVSNGSSRDWGLSD
jgi:hypothetical protein